jgi:hypothetical protein
VIVLVGATLVVTMDWAETLAAARTMERVEARMLTVLY